MPPLSSRLLFCWRCIFCSVSAASLAAAYQNASGAEMVVSTSADAGAGSLRQSLIQAAGTPEADTITFSPALSGGQITLTTGGLNVSGGTVRITALSLSAPVTISGSGAVLRVLTVQNSAEVELSGLVISGGGKITGPAEVDQGGIANAGRLRVAQCMVQGNATPGQGAGILNTGSLTLDGCTLSGNAAVGAGGGILNLGSLAAVQSTLTGNTAASGGGLANSASATLLSCTLSGNQAGQGGAIDSTGNLTLHYNVLVGNSATAFPDLTSDFTATASSWNLVGVNSASGLAHGVNGNKLGLTSSGLGPLSNHGGRTLTMMPLSGGAPLDGGSASWIPSAAAVDQRGSRRLSGLKVDIGAVEALQVTDVAISGGLPGVIKGHITWAEFNGDALPDICLTGTIASGAKATRVYRNLGNGWLAEWPAGFPGLTDSSLAVGDFDGDGDQDLLITGTIDGAVSGAITNLYKNDGAGNFTRHIDAEVIGFWRGSAAWGDYDRDGDLDLMQTGYSTGIYETIVYQNTPTGFKWHHWIVHGLDFGASAWADFDGDGYRDAVVSGAQHGEFIKATTRFYHGGPSMIMQDTYPVTGISRGVVLPADYDRDGRPDLIVTGYDAADVPRTELWRNLGQWNWQKIFTPDLPAMGSSAAGWADWDGDGYPDLALCGKEASGQRKAYVFLNLRGTGAFRNLGGSLPGLTDCALAWADCDADGDPDLLASGTTNDLASGAITYLVRNPKARDLRVHYGTNSTSLTFTGEAGVTYRVQGSSDAVNWTNLGSAVETAPGSFSFTEIISPELRQRFYRAVQ